MKTLFLALTFALAGSTAQATTHNDCRIAYRDCMKKQVAEKGDPHACLKPKSECETKVREELKAGKKAGAATKNALKPVPKEKPETAVQQ